MSVRCIVTAPFYCRYCSFVFSLSFFFYPSPLSLTSLCMGLSLSVIFLENHFVFLSLVHFLVYWFLPLTLLCPSLYLLGVYYTLCIFSFLRWEFNHILNFIFNNCLSLLILQNIWVAYNQQKFISHSYMEAGRPRSGFQPGQVLVKANFTLQTAHFWLCPHVVQGAQDNFLYLAIYLAFLVFFFLPVDLIFHHCLSG